MKSLEHITKKMNGFRITNVHKKKCVVNSIILIIEELEGLSITREVERRILFYEDMLKTLGHKRVRERTEFEIDLQIKKLNESKKYVPEYDLFDESNWYKIDAKVNLLKGLKFTTKQGREKFKNEIKEVKDWLNFKIESLFEKPF